MTLSNDRMQLLTNHACPYCNKLFSRDLKTRTHVKSCRYNPKNDYGKDMRFIIRKNRADYKNKSIIVTFRLPARFIKTIERKAGESNDSVSSIIRNIMLFTINSFSSFNEHDIRAMQKDQKTRLMSMNANTSNIQLLDTIVMRNNGYKSRSHLVKCGIQAWIEKTKWSIRSNFPPTRSTFLWSWSRNHSKSIIVVLMIFDQIFPPEKKSLNYFSWIFNWQSFIEHVC